ncbi:MAG: hypothetical protein BWY31_00924 [Lentisphaerae bacterium ADurb.Bin242]|nr:MAG: hypothetical protein BWY31_00924 [Lentisphaerae bacterium ADurb.Bin242]
MNLYSAVLSFLLTLSVSTLAVESSSSGSNSTAYASPGRWYDGFVYSTANNVCISQKTRFQATWDEKNLYFDVEMENESIKKPERIKFRQGKWPAGESVEIFLDPAGKLGSYFQIAIGIDGHLYDSRSKIDPDFWKKTSWHVINRKVEDGVWNLRIVLPFSDPEMKHPAKGDSWRFNICRNIAVGKNIVSASWAQVGRSFHNPAMFANLSFGSESEFASAQKEKLIRMLKVLVKRVQSCPPDKEFLIRVRQAEENPSPEVIASLYDELEVIKAMSKIQ